MQRWQLRVAPSLGGGFAGEPEDVWGTIPLTMPNDPAVFFGLYGLKDFNALWEHKGFKAVLWAGSDIRHLASGYWLDDEGQIKIDPKAHAEWLGKNCVHYVENSVEAGLLMKLGIESKVVPSFLGNVEDYPICFMPSTKPKLYTSVSGDDFELYGWHKIPKLAQDNPDVEFHLYGNGAEWSCDKKNVFVHGRVSQETFDTECKQMQGALRLTEFDGCSEILVKSILWGQYPVSTIPYPYTLEPKEIDELTTKVEPNEEGRKHFLRILNNYPWNANLN